MVDINITSKVRRTRRQSPHRKFNYLSKTKLALNAQPWPAALAHICYHVASPHR
jgi:hypothetical protein